MREGKKASFHTRISKPSHSLSWGRERESSVCRCHLGDSNCLSLRKKRVGEKKQTFAGRLFLRLVFFFLLSLRKKERGKGKTNASFQTLVKYVSSSLYYTHVYEPPHSHSWRRDRGGSVYTRATRETRTPSLREKKREEREEKRAPDAPFFSLSLSISCRICVLLFQLHAYIQTPSLSFPGKREKEGRSHAGCESGDSIHLTREEWTLGKEKNAQAFLFGFFIASGRKCFLLLSQSRTPTCVSSRSHSRGRREWGPISRGVTSET